MSLPGFGVRQPVAVNLLMAAMIVGGLYAAMTLRREFFPETEPESATLTLIYPGALPQEIEESMVRKVEDKLADLDEVEKIQTNISEGGAGISVEFRDGIDDITKAVDEVEQAVDTLTDMPAEAERIRIQEFEPMLPVIMLNLYGPADEEAMKRSIRQIRDDLELLEGMGDVSTSGVRDYELRIDLAMDELLKHRISLPQVSDVITAWMTDVPGGAVRSEVGNINVRTMGVSERSEAVRDIVVKATPGGQAIRVRDIADVREFYVDEQIMRRFNGEPAVSLTVNRVGDQDAVEIAEMVRSYARGRSGQSFEPHMKDRLFGVLNKLRGMNANAAGASLRSKRRIAYDLAVQSNRTEPLPAGCKVQVSSDLARFIEGRLDLLLRNAKSGAILVFGTLLLFLNWRVAFWTGAGLVTALCGTLMVMALAGVTLNLLTMFGLIIVIGLLVDDAIVVAENIQARHDRGEPSLVAAIKGADEVFWPVVATVLTSIVAFLPLLFIKGQIGDLLGALPWVVVCALAMSLVEAVLVLPSHMGHTLMKRDRAEPGRAVRFLHAMEARRDRVIFDFLVPWYARFVGVALHYRYITLAAAAAAMIVSAAMIAGGRVEFTFLPTSDSETIIADVRMPIGSAIEQTEAAVKQIEQAAQSLQHLSDPTRASEVQSISTLIGVRANVDDTTGISAAGFGTHLGQLFIELAPVEQRDRESADIIADIRERAGHINGAQSLQFTEIGGGPGGADITIEVAGDDQQQIEAVVEEIRVLLDEFPGIHDISDNNDIGQRELRLVLKPGAAALGLSVSEVARQVRGALFGLEAHVFSEKREDIDVRVRLDERSRRDLHAIENLWIISPNGARVPLTEIAAIERATGYASIKRIDRQRAVTVTADTAPDTNPEAITPILAQSFPDIQQRHPGITIEMGGRQRQLAKAFASLPLGFLAAMIMIYVILAWLFGSYIQPLAVMLAIPFSLIGVIWGHYLLGYQLTFLSLIGFVALSGIVVNDSIILIDFYNHLRANNQSVRESLIGAGKARLRAILLTTITTVLGLTPLMLEQSFQAKFLIPMAVSIAFGLITATALILIVLPCIMVIVDDITAASHYLWYGQRRQPTHPEPLQPEID